MVEEEEAVGVVFLLDALKVRIVVAPEGVLLVRLEVVRLPDKEESAPRETHRGAGAIHQFPQTSRGLFIRGPDGSAGTAGIAGHAVASGRPTALKLDSILSRQFD